MLVRIVLSWEMNEGGGDLLLLFINRLEILSQNAIDVDG
jgi:hypothetical protein